MRTHHGPWRGALAWTVGAALAGAARAAEDQANPTDLFKPDAIMVVLTWVTFLIVLGVLYKYALRHIFAGLDAREQKLRQSLDDAERLARELAEIEQRRAAILAAAEAQSAALIAAGRQAAAEAARVIADKARHEAHIQLENTTREIATATAAARALLRRESAETAVALASRLIERNLDDAANRALTDSLIERMQRDHA